MNVPDFIIPWLDRFYTPLEMELLQILAEKPLEEEQIRKVLSKSEIAKDDNNVDFVFNFVLQNE
jgi:hypothetical protein